VETLPLFPSSVTAESEPEPVSDRAREPGPEPGPEVEIRPSTRRRKTVAAHWEGDRIVVVVPHRMAVRDRREYADHLVAKLLAARAQSRPSDEELLERARLLSRRHLDGRAEPRSVRWSSRQRSRWGSCTTVSGDIRISDRLRDVPGWVLDAVLVHELVHLLHADHGPEFHALADRYPRMADSDHFLAGYQLGLERTPEL
jgi:predicted metal-dependent hydrolase